jgi:hypothetical protein
MCYVIYGSSKVNQIPNFFFSVFRFSLFSLSVCKIKNNLMAKNICLTKENSLMGSTPDIKTNKYLILFRSLHCLLWQLRHEHELDFRENFKDTLHNNRSYVSYLEYKVNFKD